MTPGFIVAELIAYLNEHKMSGPATRHFTNLDERLKDLYCADNPSLEIRGERQRESAGLNQEDVAGGLAPHPSERALHISQ